MYDYLEGGEEGETLLVPKSRYVFQALKTQVNESLNNWILSCSKHIRYASHIHLLVLFFPWIVQILSDLYNNIHQLLVLQVYACMYVLCMYICMYMYIYKPI